MGYKNEIQMNLTTHVNHFDKQRLHPFYCDISIWPGARNKRERVNMVEDSQNI